MLLRGRATSVRRDAAGACCVERFALGGDATHLTGGDPDARLLRHLLHQVIDGRPVDLIHAHGTGTELNDATELAAIEATVGDGRTRPVVYSHKAALGHSLGASGLLSVVLNCLSHTTGVIPPNVRTTDPLPTRRVTIPQTATRRPVRRSVAIAAGFGGPTAVVSLTSAPDARNPLKTRGNRGESATMASHVELNITWIMGRRGVGRMRRQCRTVESARLLAR